ncbi:MAG: peptide ABC transporter substrate-binding protein [Reyranellaceae bacterium]
MVSALSHKALKVLAAAVSLAVVLLLQPQQAAAKDELTIGTTQYPSTLHPMFDSMLAKSIILAAARRPFTAIDPQWSQICMLCVEVPTLENGLAKLETRDGKPGMSVTVTIRDGVKWADGTPVTSADVVFAWEVGKHPQSQVTAAEYYRRITAIDVKDARTFTIHIDRQVWNFTIYIPEPLPAHIEKPIFDADPAQYRNRTKYDTDQGNPGLYYGPYRVVSATPGASVVLETNPHWSGVKPHFRRITFRTIENTAALEANLLSGSVDYILGELGLTLDQALAFEKRNRDRFDVVYKPGLVYEHIDLNLENPLLADRRVRQALLHGIDRKAIVDKLFQGKQPVAHGYMAENRPEYDPTAPHYAYDPKKAAQLLDAAGFTTMKDGYRHSPEGKRLSLELATTGGNRVRELVQQVLQSQWKQIGIEIRLRAEPPRVFSATTLSKRELEAMAMYAWISSPLSVPHSMMHSTQIPTAENGWIGQNYPAYRSPQMDRIVESLETELDAGKRKALWGEFQRLYATDLPVLPLFFRTEPFVIPKWLKGIEPTGHLYSTTLWIEHWRDAR